jgi:hypothetical protein
VLLLAVDMLKPDDRDWPLPWMNWVMTGSARPDPQWLIERLTGSEAADLAASPAWTAGTWRPGRPHASYLKVKTRILRVLVNEARTSPALPSNCRSRR